MPFALVFIGLILIVTGVRGTYAQLGKMVAVDMTGANGGSGFLLWGAAIGGVGAIGAVPQFRTFSHAAMALILISIVLSKSNATFFTNAINQLKGTKSS